MFCAIWFHLYQPRYDNDAWVEHAKWSPRCFYVLIGKGKTFVDGILNNWHLSLPSNEQQQQQQSLIVNEGSVSGNVYEVCKVCYPCEVPVLFFPLNSFSHVCKLYKSCDHCVICRHEVKGTVPRFYLLMCPLFIETKMQSCLKVIVSHPEAV